VRPNLRIAYSLCLALGFLCRTEPAAADWNREVAHDRGTEFEGFVSPSRLYWRPFALPGVQAAEFKLLSFDESTGARTLLVKLPPGWKQAAGYHSADVEMFVVEGGVTVGDEELGRYGYTYWPAGHAHAYSTEFGATVVQMWSGRPDYVASAQSRPGARGADAIDGWRYGDAPSIGPSELQKHRDEPYREDSPVRIKLLRHDAATGEKTWIAVQPGGGRFMQGEGLLPPWAASESWLEGYLLAGNETIAECLPQGEVAGTYAAGDYYFRPAGQRHGGPGAYSTSYAIWLLRSGPGHRLSYHDACAPAPGEG